MSQKLIESEFIPLEPTGAKPDYIKALDYNAVTLGEFLGLERNPTNDSFFKKEIRIYEKVDSLFKILRKYEENLPVLLSKSIINPSNLGPSDLPENQIYLGFKKIGFIEENNFEFIGNEINIITGNVEGLLRNYIPDLKSDFLGTVMLTCANGDLIQGSFSNNEEIIGNGQGLVRSSVGRAINFPQKMKPEISVYGKEDKIQMSIEINYSKNREVFCAIQIEIENEECLIAVPIYVDSENKTIGNRKISSLEDITKEKINKLNLRKDLIDTLKGYF